MRAIWSDRPTAVWVAGLGEAVGILVVAPAVWTWLARAAPLPPTRRVELAAMVLTTLAVAWFVFSGTSTPMMAVEPLPYAVFPPLFWAALRFGNREAATALLAVAVIAVWCTADGMGPFGGGDMLRNLGSLYVFLAVAAVSTMLIAVVLGERERAERGIRESEARYRMLIERMNEGLVLQDRDGAMTFVSDRFCEIVGRQREWLLGRKGLDLAAPGHEEHWHAQHRKRQQGVAETFEIALQKGNGEVIDAFVSPRPHFDAAGGYLGSFALLMDVTERRRAERALRDSEEKLRLIVENQTELVLKLDGERRVVFASPSFLAYFGLTEAEVLGRPVGVQIHEEDWPATARRAGLGGGAAVHDDGRAPRDDPGRLALALLVRARDRRRRRPAHRDRRDRPRHHRAPPRRGAGAPAPAEPRARRAGELDGRDGERDRARDRPAAHRDRELHLRERADAPLGRRHAGRDPGSAAARGRRGRARGRGRAPHARASCAATRARSRRSRRTSS